MATYTFYPVAGQAADGNIQNSETSWAAARDNTGDTVNSEVKLLVQRAAGPSYTISRAMVGFDTSGLIDSITILSGTFSLFEGFGGSAISNNFTDDIVLTSATPDDVTALEVDDFLKARYGATEFTAARKAISAVLLAAYNDFTLNASGILNINRTGVSVFGVRFGDDFDNTAPGSNGTSQIRFFGSNETGTTKDPKLVVVTTDPPSVTSSAATAVLENSATLNGNVTSDGGQAITQRGFLFSDAPGVNLSTGIKLISSGTTGAYTAGLTGLLAGKTYYWCAYAINVAGTTYSTPELSFTTLTDPPDVETIGVADIAPTTVTGRGRVNSANGLSIIEMGVVVALDADPDTSDTKFTLFPVVDDYEVTMSGLTISTQYHMRAFARNADGTTYGADVSFETTATQDRLVFDGVGLQNRNVVNDSDLDNVMPQRDLQTQPVPRDDGEVVTGDNWRRKTIPLAGIVWDDTRILFEQRIDDMKKHLAKRQKILDITKAGTVRRYIATLINPDGAFGKRDGYDDGINACPYDFKFACLDSFGYSPEYINNTYLAQTDLTFNATIANDGTTKTKPIFEIDVTAVSGITNIEIENFSTGERVSIPVTLLAGDLILVDCERETMAVLQNGDPIDFSGVFLNLETDDNDIGVTFMGTSITYDLREKHHNRYL